LEGVTSADIKLQKLHELKKRMREDVGCRKLWFFNSEDDRVAGYDGTEPVMFVAQRPSGGTPRGSGLASRLGHCCKTTTIWCYTPSTTAGVAKARRNE